LVAFYLAAQRCSQVLAWTDGDVKDAAKLMKPAAEKLLQKWPVSRRVNNPRTADDDAALIEHVELAA
jgi:putative SOS response-associated peptidase YedK